MEVISGYEDKKSGDIFITVGMADGYVKGKNGIGYADECLEEWHNSGYWIGKMQNAHPSKNHPLVYEPKVDPKLGESAQLDYYVSKSNKWAFGTFVKTELKKLANGITRLLGTFRITEDGAKQAWREGKFPKFSSISTLMKEYDKNGFTTKAHPIASSSVENPAMDIDVAKIHAECTGDEHTCGVTKVGESAEVNCSYCRHDVLTSFKDTFSSHSTPDVQESSMGNDTNDASSPPATGDSTNQELEGKEPKVTEPATIQGDEETPEEKVDYKAKWEESEKAMKKSEKAFEEHKKDTDTKLEKLFKEKLESKIRNQLDKIPLLAFDNKEENRESEIKRFLKLYPRLTEDEIVENVETTYKLAPKMKAAVEKAAKVGESGITNEGKLVVESATKSDTANIMGIDEVFGE